MPKIFNCNKTCHDLGIETYHKSFNYFNVDVYKLRTEQDSIQFYDNEKSYRSVHN